jgi:signal transduction histidine kinase/ActR/RegA family two-component response regulator
VADEQGIAPEHDADDGAVWRLTRDLADVREQFAATSEILTALGRAGADPSAILDTIVERAASLCGADAAQLYLLEDGTFHISRVFGLAMEEYARYWREHPSTMSTGRATLAGRVALERRIVQIDDVLNDHEYGRQDLQRLAGFRTMLSAPMIVDDEVVGVLGVWRTTVARFDERAVELLGVFAAQAAIVVENVGLVRALESRSAELASKIEQLEALREVGEAVSSSLNLQEVLEQIVANAVRMTDTDGGSIMEYNEHDDCFEVRSAFGSSDALLEKLRGIKIRRESTLVGRAALDRRPLEVADLAEAPLDPHLQTLYDDGWRSVLAVPMSRQDRMVGALVIRRKTPGTFSADTLELLETFASQSALTILNARLFQELEVRSSELAVVSRHKSEFLASMSHELRTPLNAVIGFSEVLLDRMFGDINDRQEEYLRDIRSSGLHLLELLNEILDLSKVEAGRMELEPAVFPVRDALEYTLSLVRERAVQHDVTLDLDVAPDVREVLADPLRFKQVVLNLLSNAVKFTPDHGRVTLAASVEDDGLHVTVTDTGVGIPPEDRERIFESFQQGGRGTTREEGTGLGLTLTRRIVELFGGRLWLDTTVGAGSTFGFSLPMDRAAPTVDASDEGEVAPSVLLVDDDRASLDLVTAYLDGTGVDVVRARDGEEALAVTRRIVPAVVVLDIRLPKVDGWEVLRELKADPATADVPVVVVSIVDEPARGRSLGASAYLTKPVRRESLLAALRTAGLPLRPVTRPSVSEGSVP